MNREEAVHHLFARKEGERICCRMYEEETFVIKNFRHPISGRRYIVEYKNGFVTVERKAKSHKKKRFTCDSFCYLWMENEDLPTQNFLKNFDD